MLKPGQKIGKYEILNELGTGGMGTVFLCRDHALARNVAIKVINPQLEGVSNVLRRFQNEARAIAQLSSQHVVNVYEYNSEAVPPHLVMEFVRGRSLGQIIREEAPLTPQITLNCARQILRGLVEAHSAGVIHRDIKPANIIQSESGTYKLMDFGLARSLDRKTKVTSEGTLLGTVAYMAPEVASGDPASVQSDLYSLGVTLYEMLCGLQQHEELSPLKLIHRIAREPLPSIGSQREDLPPSAIAWFDKLLAHDPPKRFATAREALRELNLIVAGPEDRPVTLLEGETEAVAAGRGAEAPGGSGPDAPVRVADVTRIIVKAQQIESQGRDVMSRESLLEIARDLNISSDAVRMAVVEHQRAREAAGDAQARTPEQLVAERPPARRPGARHGCLIAALVFVALTLVLCAVLAFVFFGVLEFNPVKARRTEAVMQARTAQALFKWLHDRKVVDMGAIVSSFENGVQNTYIDEAGNKVIYLVQEGRVIVTTATGRGYELQLPELETRLPAPDHARPPNGSVKKSRTLPPPR